MKRILSLSVLFIVLCINCRSQWYQRKYGVTSLNDLTESQLKVTLGNLKSGQRTLIIVMSSVTAGSVIMVGTANYAHASANSGWAYAGVIIFFLEFITSPVWVSALIVNGVRISQVKKALVSSNLKVSVDTAGPDIV